jgi:hypothetical protein
MAELVDAHGSGPCAFGCGGSSPLLGTSYKNRRILVYKGLVHTLARKDDELINTYYHM